MKRVGYLLLIAAAFFLIPGLALGLLAPVG